MTEKPDSLSAQAVEVIGTEAPFIYFDGIVGTGVYGSAILQIELIANVLTGHTVTDQKVAQRRVGHLRCSIIAARQLKAAVDLLLSNFEKPADPMQAN